MLSAVSIYLDLVRFAAAFTVFLGHVSGERLTGGLRGLWHLGRFGDNAVIVFFVLSGFVIAHVVENRENALQIYAVCRLARIYSVALPALVATFLLDAIGRTINPDAYNIAWGYVDHDRLWQFLSGVLFLNRLWFNNVPQGSDLPYWSLGYEVWYYLIFELAIFAPPRWRWGAALAALAVAGPGIALLFPIWLLGVVCYRFSRQSAISPRLGLVVWVATIAAYTIYAALLLRRLVSNALTLDRYIVGVCFAINVAGFQSMSPLLEYPPKAVARPVRWAAGATFTLYLFHAPVAHFLSAVEPSLPQSAWHQLVVVAGTLIIVLVVAQYTERRKDLWRGWIASGLRFIISPDRPSPLPGITPNGVARGGGAGGTSRLLEGPLLRDDAA